MNTDIRRTLEAVKSGEISVDDALLMLKKEPFEDLGYAKVDLHRSIRQGAAEVIYGAGKTAGQIIGIIRAMQGKGVKTILITRLDADKAAEISHVPPSSERSRSLQVPERSLWLPAALLIYQWPKKPR